jgi:hypothetical protein
MKAWATFGPALLACTGCVSVIAAAAVSGSDQGASGRERKFAQAQKGEAYQRDREILKAANPDLCSVGKRPAFERFVEAARRDTEHTLAPEVTLAEANEWSDTLRATLDLQQSGCRAPDAPTKASAPAVPVIVLEEDTPNVLTHADGGEAVTGAPVGSGGQRATP